MLLTYEQKCDKCNGTGVFDLEVQTTPVLTITPKKCAKCDGKGTMLNSSGIELIEFIRRHL